jgi:ABC-type spermidine/putrescine transport system permease subunit I
MVHVLLPYMVLPVYVACRQIDHEQLRAAQSLGAGPLRIIRSVLLPHLRPSIMVGSAITLMLSLAFYVTPRLIGGPKNLTLATLIDNKFNAEFDIVGASAVALLLLVVVLAVFFVVDRFIDIVPSGKTS